MAEDINRRVTEVDTDDSDVDIGVLEELLHVNGTHVNGGTNAGSLASSTVSQCKLVDLSTLMGDSGVDLFCPVENHEHQRLGKEVVQSEAPRRGIVNSTIHSGDTSDDDAQEYNSYGKCVESLLSHQASQKENATYGCKKEQTVSVWKSRSLGTLVAAGNECHNQVKPAAKFDVYTDPVFGLRIINPLLSSHTLQERMVGRKAVLVSKIKHHILRKDFDTDWVLGGVLVSKSEMKTSQKGTKYSIWKLSDLKAELKTVSLFLFGNPTKELWKTAVGTVLCVLNPSILDNRKGSNDEAALSVDIPQKVMMLGRSKDLGTCRARKKNGDMCFAFVNKTLCEYCVYHVQQTYRKCSRRSDLNSSALGGGLTALRNKVLGKNEVFYGGQSYMAVPALPNQKSAVKDRQKLKLLSDYNKSDPWSLSTTVKCKPRVARTATAVQLSKKQVQQDVERIRLLRQTKLKENEVVLEERKTTVTLPSSSETLPVETNSVAKPSGTTNELKCSAVANGVKLSEKSASELGTPKLGWDLDGSNIVDLSPVFSKRCIEKAKLNAVKWIHSNGPIKKVDPNSVKAAKKPSVNGAKHILEENVAAKSSKKPKLDTSASGLKSSRFRKLMEATSRHTALLESHDNRSKDEYFDKLEMKERLEDKMLSTYKVPCKAVYCLKCKYKSFSAADQCKSEAHPLKVVESVKRFFKCKDCGHRTVTLELIPMMSCKNCASSRWERAPMMREKGKTGQLSGILSIRGGEQKFINSAVTDASLNLLVPE